jgi:uncharacterized repeat protein (TIGR02543 family)
VTANPSINYHFDGWTGDSTTSTNPLIVRNVTSDITVTANFAINQYDVTFNAGANGDVNGQPQVVQTVNHGSDCTPVTANPSTGYHFDGWTGDYTGMTNPLTITNVTSDMTITANFAIDTHTVTFVEGSNGSITGTLVQNVTHGSNCSQVTAVADENHHFNGWTGDYTGMTNPLTVNNVTSDITITANFAINEYIINVNSSTGGTITPEGPVTVNYGQDSPEFTITPDANYTIVDVKVDDVSQGSITSYQFINIQSDHTISATFDYITDISNNSNSVKAKTASFFAVPNPVTYSNNRIDIYYLGNFRSHTELRIYDPVGNVVHQNNDIVLEPSKKPQKVESWNLRNMNGKKVSGGIYLAVFIYTDINGITRREFLRVGIKAD